MNIALTFFLAVAVIFVFLNREISFFHAILSAFGLAIILYVLLRGLESWAKKDRSSNLH